MHGQPRNEHNPNEIVQQFQTDMDGDNGRSRQERNDPHAGLLLNSLGDSRMRMALHSDWCEEHHQQ